MNSFLILGQVPGTNLEVSFLMWMELAALVAVMGMWASYRQRRAYKTYVAPTISNEPGSLRVATAH